MVVQEKDQEVENGYLQEIKKGLEIYLNPLIGVPKGI
jgi:hypothetical protein